MTAPEHIAALHRAYVNITGLDIALNMERERAWFEWLRYRSDDPFTAADLRLVVEHLRRGIRNEKRNDGCLRFRNLIEMPDFFDEERAAARKAAHTARKPKQPDMVVETTTERDGSVVNKLVPNEGQQDTSKPIGKTLADLMSTPEHQAWKKETFGK